ncbi:hypothetical protein ACWDTG_25350 [Rhodococcus zopfii]|uniref:hypothetical protein n=1 Tax=Rhodococcus zopfii TaxID=43772 RepID=UPI00111127CA|nr:hypothetical protein [Rhodococcus zopfii]
MTESDALPPLPADGRVLDARLHLLDRLLVDVAGLPVTTVDDLELDGVEAGREIPAGSAPPRVEAILSGNALPTRIFGGRPPDSRLDRIDWTDVDRIDVAVHLNVRGEDLDHLWVERWTRDRLIGRIPGGRRAAE